MQVEIVHIYSEILRHGLHTQPLPQGNAVEQLRQHGDVQIVKGPAALRNGGDKPRRRVAHSAGKDAQVQGMLCEKAEPGVEITLQPFLNRAGQQADSVPQIRGEVVKAGFHAQ